MTLTRYATIVTAAVGAPLAVLAVVWGDDDPHGLKSAVYGAVLAGVNAVCAYAIVLWAHGRGTTAFMAAVLGGMFGRMVLMLAAVAVGLGYFDLRRLPLVTALLGYFVVFLAIELLALNRRPAAELS